MVATLLFRPTRIRVDPFFSSAVTRNETLRALRKPEDLILAIVQFQRDRVEESPDLTRPFQKQPDLGVASVAYNLAHLLSRYGTR